jgi:geranylgeranyl pyrophosphate synthase
MLIPLTSLPRAVPVMRERAPQANIPQSAMERLALKTLIADYVETNRTRLVPPLVLDELRQHADEIMARARLGEAFRDYVGVLLGNEVWREQLATVPYERRLLLLPKCLRIEDKCPAPFDEFGLLCKQCGLCTIQELQEEAEKLGYAVLVAEGSALVMSLIQTGKIDAIVGVSCLSVLERAFPYMEAAAIPGIAIPLLQDDCKDTTVDLDWIWDVVHLTSDDHTRRLDLDAIRTQVDGWFTLDALDAVLGPVARGTAGAETEQIARAWLARAGKRWRPFLTVCTWKALQDEGEAPLPDDLRKVALAVECFHKASLIHDDIEDGDAARYGEAALHVEYGVPIALNVGDLLVGEGYRLLAECDATSASVRGTMIRIASAGHRTLCLGQGAELSWAHAPAPLTPLQVVEIFRRKTAPAFEVALRLGAALAGASDEVHRTLTKYSEALGIAYQIRDDLSDLDAGDAGEAGNDLRALRPSLPLALAFERAKGEQKQLLDQVWRRAVTDEATLARVRAIIADGGSGGAGGAGGTGSSSGSSPGSSAEERCRGLLEAYKEQAIRALPELEQASLKGLLRRVLGKVFSVEIKGWCREFETRNAAGGAAVTQTVG